MRDDIGGREEYDQTEKILDKMRQDGVGAWLLQDRWQEG